MIGFLARRVAVALPLLIGVTVLVFGILRLIPGDPAQILLFGSNPSPQQVMSLRHELSLDRPLPIQYLIYLNGLLHGDLGYSYVSNSAVWTEIAQRLPYTANLA